MEIKKSNKEKFYPIIIFTTFKLKKNYTEIKKSNKEKILQQKSSNFTILRYKQFLLTY